MTPDTMYEAPGHFSPAMRDWWSAVHKTFELDEHHEHLLRLGCEAFDRAQEARRVLQREGLTYVDRFSQPKPRAENQIEQNAVMRFARLVRELQLDDAAPEDARPPRLY